MKCDLILIAMLCAAAAALVGQTAPSGRPGGTRNAEPRPAASLVTSDTKTDVPKEIYVEASKPDYPLTVTRLSSASTSVLTWEIKPPVEGRYTLICFIDGKFWSAQSVKLPGQYKLNTRGLAPGRYQITLQVADRQGGLGVERITFAK